MVCCRQIRLGDRDAIIDLLTQGFERDRHYWEVAFERLHRHHSPHGYPKYGYLLEAANKPVGVVLLIHTLLTWNGESRIRCNLSSWYVEPNYRCYATLLSQRASGDRSVTYINISPAPHTWPILEAQRFKPFATGRLLVIPLLARRSGGVRLHVIQPGQPVPKPLAQALPAAEINLLKDHADYGCLSVVGEANNEFYPFVFGLHQRHHMRLASLVYCHDSAELALFASALGYQLARQGCFVVVMDADRKPRRLAGIYRAGARRYIKGPHPLHPGDLAYCEQVMFGY